MRRIRYLTAPLEGRTALVEVTLRTVQSRFLLRPSCALNAIFLGVVARAVERYGVDLHCVVNLSNHTHFLLSVQSVDQLSSFMRYVGSNLARKIGRLHGWRERFWSRRYSAIEVAEDEETQVERLLYFLRHGTKEHLVKSPLDWPGVHCASVLTQPNWELSGWWDDWSAEYRAHLRGETGKRNRFRKTETLTLKPLPCWRNRSREEIRQTIKGYVEMIEAEIRAEQRPVLGVSKILAQHPHTKPSETKRSPAPDFHASGDQRKLLREAYRNFLEAFREAALQLKAGIRDVLFPEGCFPPGLPYVAIARAGPH